MSDEEKIEGAPETVVKEDLSPEDFDEDLMQFIGSELGFAELILDKNKMNKFTPPGEDWKWEEYQRDYLECPTWWVGNKPRQTGISTGFAAKAFARANLYQGNYTAIFVSYKKEEAINKIRYVKQFLQALPPRFQKKILRDPLQLIEWENANGTISKIISHAQKPIRGHHGDVFLDELAFCADAEEIYKSALPAVAQVEGTVDITSTPFGKSGKFYDIVANKQQYPEFTRQWIYWWHCRRYLKDRSNEYLFRAMREAPEMEVEERVRTFGNHKVQIQFDNLDMETFKQEFEGYFVDESSSFFSKALIFSCMYDDEEQVDDYAPLKKDFTMSAEEALQSREWPIQQEYPDVRFKKYDSFEELRSAVQRGEISSNLYGGADIGKTRNSTHFTVIEEISISDGKTLQVERFSINRRGWDLTDQQDYFEKFLREGILRKFAIDGQGLGGQMGQYLKKRYVSQVKVIMASGRNTVQQEHMNNLRNRMQDQTIALAHDKVTLEDLHSIRAFVSTARNLSFRADQKGKHHGDAAWAIAFASLVGTPGNKRAGGININPSLSDINPGPDKNLIEEHYNPDDPPVSENTKEYLNKQKKRGSSSMASIYKNANSDLGPNKNLLDPGEFIENHEE